MLCIPTFACPAGSALQPSPDVVQVATPPNGQEVQFDFDIPAQPLVDALDQFAEISGRSALFPGTLVQARRSSAVRGRFTAREALHGLLQGSGLEVEEISVGQIAALVLKKENPITWVDETAASASKSRLGGYEGVMQARIWAAICAYQRTSHGGYRSLLRFRIDGAGHVRDPRLLESTGDTRRDAMLLESLSRMQFDQPPPSTLIQPVTMLILPEAAGGPVCASGGR